VIAIRFEFLAGRFHGTPWDRAVNEGDIEWPPSPWRILRALVAGWHLAGAKDVSTLRRILDRLATAPSFILPPWTAGHTRHYMPQGTLKKGKLATSLVLDAFVAFRERNARAYVVWQNVDMSSDEVAALRSVCSHITYIGRAESWCAAEVIEGNPALDSDDIVVDLASVSEGPGMRLRRLGAAADMRGQGLLRSLSEPTSDMRLRGKRQPDGTTWYEYILPPLTESAQAVEPRSCPTAWCTSRGLAKSAS